ncbi:hypothetical protein C7T87_12875 [Xanthomonas hortorum pv. hederae]|nr:hypothetical protein C7T87_12875 [Xanthomonas hortorum pv. hederae]
MRYWLFMAGDIEAGGGISGVGSRESGVGIRDSGFGIRDSGFGSRDSGLGTRDSGLGLESQTPLGFCHLSSRLRELDRLH